MLWKKDKIANGVVLERVVCVIDHHQLLGNAIEMNEPRMVDILPWGSTCTMIFFKYQQVFSFYFIYLFYFFLFISKVNFDSIFFSFLSGKKKDSKIYWGMSLWSNSFRYSVKLLNLILSLLFIYLFIYF